VTTTATAGGSSGTIYDVVLRFRGVIEQRTYEGGTQEGSWYVGGSAPSMSDTYNIYSLNISSPPQQYYLNAGTSGLTYCSGVDYTESDAYDGQFLQMDVISVTE